MVGFSSRACKQLLTMPKGAGRMAYRHGCYAIQCNAISDSVQLLVGRRVTGLDCGIACMDLDAASDEAWTTLKTYEAFPSRSKPRYTEYPDGPLFREYLGA